MVKRRNRNAHGAGTIRQRKDGRWEGRFTVGTNPGTGKQVQRSVYGKTQQEVRKKLAEATASVDAGTFLEPSKLTLGNWLDIWLAEYNPDIKPQTLITYKTQVRVHIKPALRAVKLTKLTTHMVQVFVNSLSNEKDNKPGLKPKTVKNIHSVLYGAMAQAVRLGYIRSNPCENVALPRMVPHEMHPLTKSEMTAFLNAMEGNEYKSICTVAMFTGMRLGEITGLTWDRVNFREGTILVDRQLMRSKIKGGPHLLVPVKNDNPRKLTPAPFVMQLLRKQKSVQAQMRLKAGVLWGSEGGPENLVFTNGLGRHFMHNTITHNVRRIGEAIGVKNLCFHDLRHTYAVNALRAGDDVKTVQYNLGHATAAFTLDRYGHYTDDMRSDSAARMQSFAQDVLNL